MSDEQPPVPQIARTRRVGPLEYRSIEGPLSAAVIGRVADLNEGLFGFGETATQLAGFFESRRRLLLCLALHNGDLVGFKVGFEAQPRTFESWRGGVHEDARRNGVARELMRMQHVWCQEKGFQVIKTTTSSDNVPMLIVNLQSGFEIVGSFVNRHKRLKILQEKWLVTSS